MTSFLFTNRKQEYRRDIAWRYAEKSLLARIGLWLWYHGSFLPDSIRRHGTAIANRRYRYALKRMGMR